MFKKLGKKPLVYPQLALVIASYDENKVPDAMTAAWGGIADFDLIFLSLSKTHKTVKNILKMKDFTISIGTEKTVVAVDYFGIASGNTVKDKIEKSGLTCEKAPDVDAPLLKEFPLTIECRLKSYDEDSEIMYASIINVLADESILKDEKVDPDKLEAIAYDTDNQTYLSVKGVVAPAFEIGKTLF